MILDAIFGQRNIENPSVPLSMGSDAMYDAFGAEKSAAGVRVNGSMALTVSAWWRGINLVSGDVGKLPLCAFRRIAGGKNKEAAKEHPAYRLAKRPNQEMTAMVFKRTLQGHAMSEGNGYGAIRRTKDGTPFEVIPLNPSKVYPVRYGGVLTYLYTPQTDDPNVLESSSGDQVRKITAKDVLHIKGLSFDGLCGYSVVRAGKDALGRAKATSLYGARYFRNNARPSVVLEHPQRISEGAAQKLRESWNRLHEGVDNAHRTAVLEDGLKLSSFQINARDSQLIETEQHSLIEVANYLGLPPHKVGHPARTAFSSLEQENKSYLDEALMPWLIAWEEEWEAKLLTENEKSDDSVTVEFIKQALLMGDMAARSAFYHAALLDGWMSRDEVRALENMNEMPEGLGQKYYIPTNMAIAGESVPAAMPAAGSPPAEPPDEPEVPEANAGQGYEQRIESIKGLQRDLLLEVLERIVKRVCGQAKAQATEHARLSLWLEAFRDKNRPAIRDELLTVARATGEVFGINVDPTAVADDILSSIRTTIVAVADGANEAELKNSVSRILAVYEKSRPLEITDSLLGSTCYA